MTSYHFTRCICFCHFRKHFLIPKKNTGEVHHFRQPYNSRVLRQFLEVTTAQLCSRCLQMGCRHAGGGHIEDLEPNVLTCLEHKFNTGSAGDIGDFMRISHYRSCSMGKYCSGKFAWHKKGALQVKVAVNKTGRENGTIEFDDLLCLTIIEANNHAVMYGNGD
ncbi:MAG: hypothetical protein P8017_14905 [Deltaproteobacteria bacterium]